MIIFFIIWKADVIPILFFTFYYLFIDRIVIMYMLYMHKHYYELKGWEWNYEILKGFKLLLNITWLVLLLIGFLSSYHIMIMTYNYLIIHVPFFIISTNNAILLGAGGLVVTAFITWILSYYCIIYLFWRPIIWFEKLMAIKIWRAKKMDTFENKMKESKTYERLVHVITGANVFLVLGVYLNFVFIQLKI